jgi:hypothetical protein
MKKITEAELSKRVNSLREKLILEAGEVRPVGSHDETITRDPGVDPNIALNKMTPALQDVTRLATHNGQVVAVNPAGLVRGVYDGKGGWKAGQAMPAELQNITVPAAPAAVTSPVTPPAPIASTDLPPVAPEANPTDQRLANKTQTTPAAAPAADASPAFSPAASDAAFNQALARMNEPQADSAAKVSTPAAVPVDPRDGPTGQALARMGISKQNRLDQAFVDRMLGAGKYKAGSAESNLALLKTKPTDDKYQRFDKAPVVPPVRRDAGGKYYTTGNPPRELTADEMKRYGLKESVTYADDQTLARIVSLGRR